MAEILAGFAEVEFTPEPGLLLFGQMHERVATHARDPLAACAAAFAERGSPPAVVVSVDVCVLDDGFVADVRGHFARATGLAGDRLLVHATHTHTAPATVSLMAGEADARFVARLHRVIVEAASGAIERMAPATLSVGCGQVEGLVHNRRGMFADGTSRMYGHAGEPGYLAPEGPDDTALPVIAVRRPDGALAGVLLGLSAHPCAVEGACYYSADVPGEVRRCLRERYGTIGVVFMTGAAGNASLCQIDPWPAVQPWHGEDGLRRAGRFVAAEADRTIGAAARSTDPVVHLVRTSVPVPLRPWPAQDAPNYPTPLAGAQWPEARGYYERARDDWPELEAAGPVAVPVSALRLGDAAICGNPCELFTEFGLALRAALPARVILFAELADGYAGYAPTARAFDRGGYETWPAPTSKLAPEAGDAIVEATHGLLAEVFSA